MGNNVDERVVKMGFDNRQFEQNIGQSTSSLDRLKKSLNLEGATRGLQGLDRVARNFTLGGISDTLTGISDKFSSLGIIGITTLQNLTNTAVNAGKNMISALAIEPITDGFKEYETKMGAIQTILTNTSSKGTTLEDVNGALAELNTYADQTIYNFGQMTDNIGKFTAAGLGLDDSVTTVKGMANVAAGFGVDAQRMAGATYQMTQALSAGRVQLMDWKSMEMAGMGGELLQKALKQTAKEMGVAVDEGKAFRDTLESGWLTTDIYVKTMDKMAKDKSLLAAAQDVKTFTQLFSTMKESVGSGWAVTWENIIGDKNQSTKMLTDINNAFTALIAPSEMARNEMLAFWNANGGRDAMIEGLSNAFKALGSILKPIGEAFREVFPAITGKRLVELSESFRDFTKKLKMSDKNIQLIKDAFKGLFSLIHIGVTVIQTLVKGVLSLFGASESLFGVIIGIAGAFGRYITSADKSIEKSGVLNTALEKLNDILGKIPTSFSPIEKLSAIFDKFSSAATNAFGKVKDAVMGLFNGINFDKTFSAINGGLLAGILVGIGLFVNKLKGIAKEGPKFVETVQGIFTGVKDSLKAYQNQLNAGTLVKIATAIGILAASLFVMSLVDPAKLFAATAAMSTLFAELVGSMILFQKFTGGFGFKAMATTIPMLLALSAAILILSSAMVVLSSLDWKQVAQGLTTIAAMCGILVASTKLLEKSSGVMAKSAFGLMLFAGALLIMAEAVKILGEMNIKDLAKGLASIGILCLELTMFMKLSGSSAMSAKSAAGLLLLAVALGTMALAVSILGNMKLEELAKGLGAIAGLLVILGLFMKVENDPKQILAQAGALAIMAGALLTMATAIGLLGSMQLTTLGKGLGALAGALIIMGVAMKFMSNNLQGAAALLIMAGAVAILAPAMVLLGSMKLKSIGKALLVLVGVFAVLGGASVLLTPVIPAILAVAGALALLGVACLAIGTGVAALATGLVTLASAGSAWQKVLGDMLGIMAKAIPMIIEKFGEGLVLLAGVIGEKAPVFIEAFMKLLNSLVDAIVKNVPIFVDKGIQLVVALLNGLAARIPDMIQAGYNLVIAFINGVADGLRNNTDAVIAAMKNLLDALQTSSKKMFESFAPKWMKSGVNLVQGFIDGIKSMIGKAASWAGSLASKVLDSAKKVLGINSPSKEFMAIGQYSGTGFINGLKKYGGKVVDEASGMGTSAMDSLKASMANISDIVNGNINLTPTIRPVLDMGGVNSGLSSAFDRQQSLNVSASASRAAKAYSTSRPTDTNQNGNITQHFTITVTGNQIANDYDVSRIGERLTAQLAREQRRSK